MHLQNLKCGFIPKTITWPRPSLLPEKFFTLGVGLASSRSTCQISRNIEGELLFPKRSRDPDHALFGGFFYTWVGLAVVDPLVKFKERSFIHSRNIERGLHSVWFLHTLHLHIHFTVTFNGYRTFNYEIMPATLANTFCFILEGSALADLGCGGRF